MSRKLNLLALPKKREFMACFVPPPGNDVGHFDFRAVEPHVLAHFSQDPTFMEIYGPNAWPSQDVYLIAGLQIPGLGPKIRALYDFKNPTIEGVTAAKKAFSKERKDILKPSFLGWQYGIGASTLAVNLEISEREARTIIQALDKQFPGKKVFQRRLEAEWAAQGGFVINGRGRPLPVDFGKKHDLLNRFVQSTGHDCLVRLLWHVNNYRKEHKIIMRPAVADFHDESLWYVAHHETERARECFEYGFDRLNDELNWTVILKHGGINFGKDFTVRCDD